MKYTDTLDRLKTEGNFRSIPAEEYGFLDFSTNDYLGLASKRGLQTEFFENEYRRMIPFSSSASRLLASEQKEYFSLEGYLSRLYGRPALLFNSGYHANTGLVSALADSDTLIVADKLVHASIIDGAVLSKAKFMRFKHNDLAHLEKIIQKEYSRYERIIVIVESVYSMDGDRADIESLGRLKAKYPSMMLYVDEAHAFGVCGEKGLGLSRDTDCYYDIDVIMGTFGKAAASYGAFCIVSDEVRDFVVNRSRSFIFSTAMPPINCAWTEFVIKRMVTMDSERSHLLDISRYLNAGLRSISGDAVGVVSHIQPMILGDAKRVVEMSASLRRDGIKVLPIRTPTVPPGTERLRISLSAAHSYQDIDKLIKALSHAL